MRHYNANTDLIDTWRSMQAIRINHFIPAKILLCIFISWKIGDEKHSLTTILQCRVVKPKCQCRYSWISKVYFMHFVNVFHPDWLIRSNFRLRRSDDLHKDSHQNSWICPRVTKMSSLKRRPASTKPGSDYRIGLE